MKYETADGSTVTSCPYYPDKLIGNFSCVTCKHHKGFAQWNYGAPLGQLGVAIWELECELERAIKLELENWREL
jgi:hypothetical protein